MVWDSGLQMKLLRKSVFIQILIFESEAVYCIHFTGIRGGSYLSAGGRTGQSGQGELLGVTEEAIEKAVYGFVDRAENHYETGG